MARTNIDQMLAMREMRRLYLTTPTGLKDSELALLLRLPYQKVRRYRLRLSTYEVSEGRYTALLVEGDLEYAQAILWRHHYNQAHAADGAPKPYERDDA